MYDWVRIGGRSFWHPASGSSLFPSQDLRWLSGCMVVHLLAQTDFINPHFLKLPSLQPPPPLLILLLLPN